MAGIGFFAPLPLAMMMPFMAGQSMMMGDAFGKSYQYGKRKISAMSNEDFNKLTVGDLANDIQADFNNIIPPLSQAVRQSSAFQSLIIQEMGKIIKSLPAELTQFFTGEPSTGTNLDTFSQLAVALLKLMGGGGITLPGIPPAEGAQDFTIPDSTLPEPGLEHGPPAPPLTQQQLLDKYSNWKTYRQKGGLLTEQQWRVARRGQPGGIPDVSRPPPTLEQGQTFHPQYFRQLKSLNNNEKALALQLQKIDADSAIIFKKFQEATTTAERNRWGIQLGPLAAKRRVVVNSLNEIANAIKEFVRKFKP